MVELAPMTSRVEAETMAKARGIFSSTGSIPKIFELVLK